MEEHSGQGSFYSPYLFNAKELDVETGNYYYGARYYNPKVSIWLSVDPKAYAFPSVSPYIFNMNNPVMMIDPGGDSTMFYNAQGDLIYQSNDGLDNAVVVVGEEGMEGVQGIIEGIENGNYEDSDEMWQNARDHGTSYEVGDFFGYYDSHSGDVYTGGDVAPIDGQGPLIEENSIQLFNNNGVMQMGGKEDNEGAPNMSILYSGADANAHTHPNDGRRVRLANGRTGPLGSMKSDIINSRQNSGSGIFDVAIRKNELLFYNRGGVKIKHSRNAFKR